MDDEQARKLREPFPPSAIGKLPKAGLMLDYVGHAATTDRLLQVDPAWSWQPMALDERGLPALDEKGNLWILLTVCGVTRPGVGDGTTMKERIGDAIRNAAMRFGVALDLWAKEDLGAGAEIADDVRERQKERIQRKFDETANGDRLMTKAQMSKLGVLVGRLRDQEDKITTDQLWAAVAKMRQFPVDEMVELLSGKDDAGNLHFGPLLADLRRDEASQLIDRLERLETQAAV
jgi:hypothetical protein